jgi:hypothetical protein
MGGVATDEQADYLHATRRRHHVSATVTHINARRTTADTIHGRLKKLP